MRHGLPPLLTDPPLPPNRRPRCLSCGKRLKPKIDQHGDPQRRFRAFAGRYGDGCGFCGDGCAARFGRLVRTCLRQLPTACHVCGTPVINPWPELTP